MKINDGVAGVAEALHESLCHFNHTDGCGWFYDDWEKVSKSDKYNPRIQYYKKAEKITELIGVKKALEIAKIVGEY